MTKIKLPGHLKALTILLLLIVIIYILIIGRSLLIPIMLGGYIAMLLIPACNWMETKRFPRPLAAVVALLTSLAVLVGLILLVILQVRSFSRDFEDVSGRLNQYLADLDQMATDVFGANLGIENGVDKTQLYELLESNSETVSNFLLSTIGSLSGVVLLPVFIFFMLIYRDHLANFIAKFFVSEEEEQVKSTIRDLRKVVQYYIIGMVKVMGILAVLNTVALYSIGVEHAVFFGLFAALLNIIPYLGPFLGAILPFIFAFLTMDGLIYPLMVVMTFTVIQLIESNLLTPKIVGGNVNLNALVTFLGLLIGGAIWGVIGMILIIPTLAILKRIFELKNSTKPFAYLFGEEEIKPVFKSEKNER
ncbi:Predicted PurR-regulated permease PerM [Cyclobacterium xiamenense]|uniref:Predicted PurR-regulated permease PerM n=1 Tax=Cyclobacterium xiamenense TaxID=1297121 RepID=A0A1H7B7C7_9BACT|nr:AI-2E family transporter [Cyclobacterium xiamenense]SEJ73609.1 Predicted PurR-regulated permease PerM [Cyclobacterium xiamenense]